ncbi:signal transduction histidine kinase [Anoxybacillus voinovskiensis]|uniref:histidine kinase n=1 Tax=Anoxybacteroides voinovskiense TaxID=230470 RepID=A0A840DL90_9BACL|nr:ATP-binding protein [Anoxybacillus voinovskiensis]MBB4072473.1 signal transduction histidine kinase [Anoxybacillus voinovskiensis]
MKQKQATLYLALVSLVGVGVFFMFDPFSHMPRGEGWGRFVVCTVTVFLLNYYIIRLPPKGNSLSMDSSVYLALIFVFGVRTTLLILLVGSVLSAFYRYKMSWLKHTFNFAMYVLMICGAYEVFLFFGGEVGPLRLHSMFAYLLALVTYFCVNIAIIGGYFLVVSSESLFSVIKGVIKEALSNYVITLASSFILAMMLVSYPLFGLVLFTFITVLLSFVFQKYLSLYEEVSKDKAYIEQIVNSLPVGIITVDETKRDVSVNASAMQLLQLDETKIKALAMSAEKPQTNVPFWELLFAKEMLHNVKVPYQADDERHTLLVSQTELTNQYRQVIGRIFYFIDITESEELTKRMHQAEKLALLGELSARAAHEIRNPLTVIRGFLTFMKETIPEQEKEKYQIPLLLKELDRINGIIEEMLLTAKPGVPMVTEAYMEEMVRELLPLFQQTSQQLQWHIRLDRVPLLVDPKQMTQVLYNLLRNSIEAMKGSGTISIYSRVQQDRYEIYIEDSGSGIPKEIQPTLFDPFMTTKESGTGLGLTIVKRIIENHGGTIELYKSSEQGTTFLLTLPIKNGNH